MSGLVLLGVVVALVLVVRRHHRRAGQIMAGQQTRAQLATTEAAWKFMHRKRFRLGPRSWRLDYDDTGRL